MAEFGVYIEGKGGNIGQDLLTLAAEQDIEICTEKNDADFVALCLPSYVAEERLLDGRHNDKVVIDFSGVAKRKRLGQYGLMLGQDEPWDRNFNPHDRIFGNPGCIAGATLRGLHQSNIITSPPKKLAIFATGGNSYAHSIDTDDVRLANRLIQHPHVDEITLGLRGLSRVTSFMPTAVGGFERGLMVGVSGLTSQGSNLDYGVENLHVRDVVGTADLQHRLEIQGEMENGYQFNGYNFSLGVVIDNLRFVTQNAVDLMHHVARNSQLRYSSQMRCK